MLAFVYQWCHFPRYLLHVQLYISFVDFSIYTTSCQDASRCLLEFLLYMSRLNRSSFWLTPLWKSQMYLDLPRFSHISDPFVTFCCFFSPKISHRPFSEDPLEFLSDIPYMIRPSFRLPPIVKVPIHLTAARAPGIENGPRLNWGPR
jgi:hypothetical protein